MPASKKKLLPAKRLAIYRRRAEKSGMRRVEVAVPATDVAIIRNFARAFREGGAQAERLRREEAKLDHPRVAETGAELVAILRRGAEGGFELDLPPRPQGKQRAMRF